ncbi:Zn(2)-C6 fungal-type DNA-binding domain protein [Akanthomyces lecanii RCEF 1005]|uniref:Zn(2)-C6 fungal-type DNA-binding domain protein n=1 Tax=Akanthomyces lecanii RCEF 1005 TaxID=1081108 RepID=A0A162KW60_CORDF|nr:Zn(2)-C6 fungal-type DNA-binding domain protein [Akanthomyces lecanii RCEF 1005]
MVQKGKEAAVDRSQHCHTCRRQRLRCDGVRPTCNKCLARGVDCLGYGTQALLWVQPQSKPSGTQADHQQQQKEQETTPTEARQGRKKGRPKLVLMQRTAAELALPDGEELELTRKPKATHLTAYRKYMKMRGFRDEYLRRRKIVLSPGLDPEGYQMQRLIIDSLRYYDEHVCSDLVLLDTPANPFRVLVEFWSYLPDIVSDPLVSVSAVHRISKTQSALEVAAYVPGYKYELRRNRLLSVKHPLVPVVFRHQQRMAGALAAMVADAEQCEHRGLLEAITTLILCEVQQSLFGDWDKHLLGAQAIIAARGGIETFVSEKLNPVNFDLCTVMQVAVMRDVGSPSCLLRAKKAVLEDYLEHVIPVYQEGWLSGFPCTDYLMSSLIRINMARYDDYQDRAGVVARLHLRRKLLEEVVAFSPAAWLDSCTQQLKKVFGERAKEVEQDSTRCALLDLIQSFQLSTMLYATRTLFLDNGIHVLIGATAAEVVPPAQDRFSQSTASGSIIDLRQAEAATLAALDASLRRVWATEQASPDWFGKFTVWPLFMLGMSIHPAAEPDETKDFVCRSLLRLGHHMGSMAYKDAIWAMQHTWEQTERLERSHWLGELPLDVLPGLFFM